MHVEEKIRDRIMSENILHGQTFWRLETKYKVRISFVLLKHTCLVRYTSASLALSNCLLIDDSLSRFCRIGVSVRYILSDLREPNHRIKYESILFDECNGCQI